MVNRILIRGLDNGDNFESAIDFDEAEFNEHLKNDADLQRDKIAEGRVIRVENDFVIVGVGSKSEAPFLLRNGKKTKNSRSRAASSVLVEEPETMSPEEVQYRGMIVLSKRKAAKIEAWDRLMETIQEGDVCEGRVIKEIKGGLLVDIGGVVVFLPASQVDIRRPTSLNSSTSRSSASSSRSIRRVAISSLAVGSSSVNATNGSQLLRNLKLDSVALEPLRTSPISEPLSTSAVSSGLHITDMSWGRVTNPSGVVKLDDQIEIVI